MSHRHAGPRPPRQRRSIDTATLQILSKIFRDLVIFILGAYGFYYELTRMGPERPQILIMSAAMMGLPLIIRGDERRQEAKANDRKEGSPNDDAVAK